ncbi:MAG: hypothetical protein U9N53_04785 [Bacteroidota bacterium]|nr:hypothetical protein [Bacteroidota bacterium]
MATKKTSSNKAGSSTDGKEKKKPGFFSEASENIEAGARLIGKKASKLASELADTAGKIKEEVKGLESEALVTARGKIDELSDKAQVYLDKYKHRSDINRLAKERDVLIKVLGQLVYLKLKSRSVKKENLADNEEVKNLVKNIKKKDREIINAGKESDK